MIEIMNDNTNIVKRTIFHTAKENAPTESVIWVTDESSKAFSIEQLYGDMMKYPSWENGWKGKTDWSSGNKLYAKRAITVSPLLSDKSLIQSVPLLHRDKE